MKRAILPFFFLASLQAEPVTLYYDETSPQISFAADDLEIALEKRGFDVKVSALGTLGSHQENPFVVLALDDNRLLLDSLDKADGDRVEPLADQGYALRTTRDGVSGYWIFGGDETGAMYGGLEIAERIERHGFAERYNEDHEPYIAKRGIKLNIPLDSRAPSYDSDGDSAHFNVKHMWDLSFWHEYIDTLARYRYNVISLWNSHPFNALCSIPEYPDTALPDVHDYDGLVKKMTMEEKVAFWREVFDYATDRGFDIYWFNWNVYAYGANGKYGIEDNPRNEAVKEYSRKALYAFLKTYPQIDAFGVSAGEHFAGFPAADREKWMREVWGEAMLDYKRDHPEHGFFFIHRFLMTDITPIADHWNDFPLPWDISFKYGVGHMHGYHNPDFIYAKGVMRGLDDHNKKTWLNLRNDDIFYFRWGDPEYARKYVINFPVKDRYLAGYYMGTDGYVFAKTFSYQEKYDNLNNRLEIDKHWYNFLIWGRMGYDPKTAESFFIEQLAERFPDINTRRLYNAWKIASNIFPTVSQTICRDNDAQWWVEGCHSKFGYIDIERLLGFAPQPGTPVHSIADYAQLVSSGKAVTKTTPLQKAEDLHSLADETEFLIRDLNASDGSELYLLLNDMRAMANASRFYAEKIRGALYHKLGDKKKAISSLEKALVHATEYADLASAVYKDQHMARHNPEGKNSGIKENKFTWAGFVEGARQDLEIAKSKRQGRTAHLKF